jgi:uncharacterized RDD family membrane protein YckC
MDAPSSPDSPSSADAPSSAPPPSPVAPGAQPDLLTRFLAFFIDAVIVAVIGLVPVVGGLVGILYILTRDGLAYDFMDGRSIGKKLMKLRPVRLDGLPMDVRTSVRRNWPLAFGSLTQALLFVPVIGWILIPVVGLAGLVLVIIEIVRVVTRPDGRRWGDELAGTRVIVSTT